MLTGFTLMWMPLEILLPPCSSYQSTTRAQSAVTSCSPAVVGMKSVNFMYQELQIISQHHLTANLSCLFPLEGDCPGHWDVSQRPPCP